MSDDANGDGYRHTFEDEFIELHKIGPTPIGLGGCSLADDKRLIFSFPASTVLFPDARAVVFGSHVFSDRDLWFAAGGRLGDGRTLHGAWPGRSPFSSGAPRPVLQFLRPNHHSLHLVHGEQRQFRVHLALYNMQSQRIRILANTEFNVESHQLTWNSCDRQGQPVATGLYLG